MSNASSTVHCLAPVAKILHEAFGIERAIFTTVHSYTSQHRLADVPAEDKRRGRAAAENIIPQESRSPAMLMELLPELPAGCPATPMNVPVSNGSVVDLVCWHERPVTPSRSTRPSGPRPSKPRWKGILEFENEPIVSSDVARSPFSSTFDSLATMVLGDRVSKTLSWFDSGYGYAHRAVDLIERFARSTRGEAASMTIRVGHQRLRPHRPVASSASSRTATTWRSSAINDLFDNDHLAYLLKYDTVMRRLREGGHDGRRLR